MINIVNVSVEGFETAIRGMRSPMNSWALSDSKYDEYYDEYLLGDKDLELMKKLVRAGSDHSKFMRFINVTADITAPLYWWKEFDTYKIGTVRNSCSTMHKIHEKEFTLEDFSCEHLLELSKSYPPIIKEGTLMNIDEDPNEDRTYCTPKSLLKIFVKTLNHYRELFLKTKDKTYWWQMIQLLPSSYNQKATVQMNYAVLRNMYHARKDHKLDEWRSFCKWAESMPYSELITRDFKE